MTEPAAGDLLPLEMGSAGMIQDEATSIEEDTAATKPMGTSTLPFTSISLDVWSMILEFLPAHDLLDQVSKVSQQFDSILRDDIFWKSYTQAIVVNNDQNWNFYKNQKLVNVLPLQQMCVFATGPTHVQQPEKRGFRCQRSQSLLYSSSQARSLWERDNQWTCLASSTHHTPREVIECTLSPAIRSWASRPLSPGWWSSRPSPSSTNTKETLLYKTVYPQTYLTRVAINPLVDTFRGMVLVYGWHQTKITAYWLPPSHLEQHQHKKKSQQSLTDAQRIQALLQDQRPVYESALLPTKQLARPVRLSSNAWEVHEFPSGIIANVVVIELMGKKSREMMGYYACVEQVRMEGIPLLDDREALSMNLKTLRGSRTHPYWTKGYHNVDDSDSDSDSDSLSSGSLSGSGFSSDEDESDDEDVADSDGEGMAEENEEAQSDHEEGGMRVDNNAGEGELDVHPNPVQNDDDEGGINRMFRNDEDDGDY
ncbi:expressed unknown protein [Seminavis robusta]|uniref:F-box domain-containing protein n=1 Tax=Seminavis robusta TaxID=568900 RepID=A0A9N8EPQ5_9STRA|nr:expressed unknown protein [Seminavis robusta]|eukprot:Sro1357_g265730.1 n/a (481) ;mRNA; f:5871-7313